MSWRSIWSGTGEGVPLDVWLGLTWEPRWTSAASGRFSCWPLASRCMPGWAWSTRHRGRAVRRRVSCLDVVLQSFLLYVSWTVTPFRMNSFSPVRWLFLYRSLLVSLLCHWLVGRADGRGFQKVVPLVEGLFFVEVDREGGSERVVCCGG